MPDSVSPAQIKILPEQLINKIAAGEVVERPASIVKELLENSIDSGATQILISIKNGGKDFISILDDGSGMDESNARLALERHATSKIHTEHDLENITTLGFRGEALASIASVSHFELITCRDEKEGASRFMLQGGQLEEFGKVGFPKGTKITIQNLFFNTPARLKFMKTVPTEFRHIQETVLYQALARPHIQFRLTHNQQVILSLPKGQSLEQRIYQLFGDEFQDGIIPVEHEETYLKYNGFISTPSHIKTTKRWQYLFVNDRFVKCFTVNRALYEAYRTLLMKNHHPAFFLKIYLDPSEIDVNVHPAKTEIRFRNNQLIHAILEDHLNKSIMESSHRRHFASKLPQNLISRKQGHLINPSGQLGRQEQLEIPIDEKFSLQPETTKQTKTAPSFTKKQNLSSTKKPALLKEQSIVKSPVKTSLKNVPPIPVSSQIEANQIQDTRGGHSVEQSNQMAIVGQLFNTYIVVEKEDSLVLMDQHTAQECILFEQYQSDFYAGRIQNESFLVPILIELSPQNAILLEQYLSQFSKLGFTIEPFGKTTYSLSSIPTILPEDQCKTTILDILDELALFGKSGRLEEVFKHILEKVACHSAVPQGKVLNQEEMQNIVFQFEKINHHHFRPHGKSALIEINHSEIEKRFKRLN